MTNTCSWCGSAFQRSSGKGRAPKYCSSSCRQRAYEARKRLKALDQAASAWRNDMRTMAGEASSVLARASGAELGSAFKNIAGLQESQRLIADAMRVKVDLSPLLTNKFEMPRLLGFDSVNALAKAADFSGAFKNIAGLQESQRLIADAMRVRVGITLSSPALDFSALITRDVTQQLRTAAIGVESAVPDGYNAGLVPTRPNTSEENTSRDFASTEVDASYLLIVSVALVFRLRPEIAQHLVCLLGDALQTGVFVGDLAVEGYNEISAKLPDSNALGWAVLLANLLSWIRKRRR